VKLAIFEGQPYLLIANKTLKVVFLIPEFSADTMHRF
jgi:hypothetical protein